MKIRDSGMPDESVWSQFFDPRRILLQLAFTDADADVVDLGCGYGMFSIAAAKITTGTVHSLDIDVAMVSATRVAAELLGVSNIKASQRDIVAHGSGLPDESVDYAMLFNILHAEEPLSLLREAYRILRFGGKVGVIHWVHNISTPRGPDLAIRPHPEDCQGWVRQVGFELLIPAIGLPPYHYGVVGVKSK